MIRSAPITPAYPTSITFESATFSAMRNESRNTSPTTSSFIDACGTSGPGRARGRIPAKSIRTSRYSSTG